MNTIRLGYELLEFCGSEENRFVQIKELLESLSEDQRPIVVRYRNEVSEI